MTSLEFFQLANNKLGSNGVFMANIATTSGESVVYQRILRTIQEVFHRVWVIKNQTSNNYEIFATNGNGHIEEAIKASPFGKAKDPSLATVNYSEQINKKKNIKIITDDRPLSEVIFDKMVGKYILSSKN